MRNGNVKMALSSLRSAKWRSLLTMLGIIIGVASVVTTVSLGEGVRNQVAGQINHIGKDLITVRPGKSEPQSLQALTSSAFLGGIGGSTFTDQDVQTVRQTSGIKLAVPVGVASGIARVDNREQANGAVLATTSQLPEVLNQSVEFGTFFTDGESNRHVAVIGKRVAEQLFQENVPIGRTLFIRDQEFIIRGVFEEFEASPLTPGTDLNQAVFIPYNTARSINGGPVSVMQIFAKVDKAKQVNEGVRAIRQRLTAAHAGQEDFSVLRQEENLAGTSRLVDLITQLITGVAAISLIVGGIGIMNIMFVSVTERTREIGIRKAVGATNRQILGQFLVEAAVLSFVGGIIGVLVSILANFGIRIFTDLRPVVTLPVIVVAVGVSWIVGVVFGVTPAIRAAQKDPIEALRYE